jgi:hypothetical protein
MFPMKIVRASRWVDVSPSGEYFFFREAEGRCLPETDSCTSVEGSPSSSELSEPSDWVVVTALLEDAARLETDFPRLWFSSSSTSLSAGGTCFEGDFFDLPFEGFPEGLSGEGASITGCEESEDLFFLDRFLELRVAAVTSTSASGSFRLRLEAFGEAGTAAAAAAAVAVAVDEADRRLEFDAGLA